MATGTVDIRIDYSLDSIWGPAAATAARAIELADQFPHLDERTIATAAANETIFFTTDRYERAERVLARAEARRVYGTRWWKPWEVVLPQLSEEEATTDGGTSNDPYPAGRGA